MAKGLITVGNNFMDNHAKVILTVDCVITIQKQCVVLVRRVKEPFLDKLVLPGGHVENFDHSLSEACAREVLEEIGLHIEPTALSFLTVLSKQGRDPRPGVRVSAVYRIDLPSVPVFQLAPKEIEAVVVVLLSEIEPHMIGFDHFEALRMLKPLS